MKQQTYIMVKPEFAEKPEVIKLVMAEAKKAGMTILRAKYVMYTKEQAQKHYAEHFRGSYENAKGFYLSLEDYITSGRAYGMVMEGENSIETMRNIILSSEEKITVLALGALTNIALLLNTYPEVKANINKIYSMIGSINGNGNITNYAEFNAYFDPEAFAIVVKSGIPMVINPLELAQNSKIDKDIVKNQKPNGQTQEFIYKITNSLNEFEDRNRIGLYDLHSSLALIKPDLYNFIPCDINVSTGKKGGRCILTPNPNGIHYYQELKDKDATNNLIIKELYSM